MKYKVYYTSAKKVAEQIAEVIAGVLDVSAERLFPAYMPDGVDLMFIGCDGAHAENVVLDFISQLRPDRVRYAALFNANAKMSPRALDQMRTLLAEHGVKVLDNTLLCLSRPFQHDLPEFDRIAAKDFATASCREVSAHSAAR